MSDVSVHYEHHRIAAERDPPGPNASWVLSGGPAGCLTYFVGSAVFAGILQQSGGPDWDFGMWVVAGCIALGVLVPALVWFVLSLDRRRKAWSLEADGDVLVVNTLGRTRTLPLPGLRCRLEGRLHLEPSDGSVSLPVPPDDPVVTELAESLQRLGSLEPEPEPEAPPRDLQRLLQTER